MDVMSVARARIAAQRGELHGWRPLSFGDVAVVALQVLGTVRDEPGCVGLRVAVAGRSMQALTEHGVSTAERALRKRAVLAPDDAFALVHTGPMRTGDGAGDDPLRWPWTDLVIHVPERQLPAIAGLATDAVPKT